MRLSGDGKEVVPIASYSGAADVAIQTDGKIVAAGSARRRGEAPTRFALARFEADGSLDAAFSRDGVVTTHFEGSYGDYASGVAIQADGKIVASGWSDEASFQLARYESDGALDVGFDGDGMVSTPVDGGVAYDLVVQGDGKIVVAGRAIDHSDGVADLGDFAVARYRSGGSLDPAFGSNGMATTNFVGGDYSADAAYALALATDAKLILAGTAFDGTTKQLRGCTLSGRIGNPEATIPANFRDQLGAPRMCRRLQRR